MRRTLLATAVLVLAMLALALPAAAQEEGGQEAFCGWYWDYTFATSGGWEYWCWDPQKGWWYGQREDGKAQRITM